MLCSISGQVPTEPVVSKRSGCLFERRLIEKIIAEGGACPVTGEPLHASDIIAIRGARAAGAPSVLGASIPSLLQALHTEWDATMLEQHSLRSQLQQCQSDLSRALFQHDAACRVIAKLAKERDEWMAKLGERPAAPADPAGIPAEVVAEVETLAQRLGAQRRQKTFAPSADRARALTQMLEVSSVDVPSWRCSTDAPLCVSKDISGTNVCVGLGDGKAVVYALQRQDVDVVLAGHSRAVRAVKYAGASIATGSDDGTVRLWSLASGSADVYGTLRPHDGGVTSLGVLPTRAHVISAGGNGSIALIDATAACIIARGRFAESRNGISCVEVHPDGILFATTTLSKIELWDTKFMDVELSLSMGASSNISSVAFNEDGYTVAALSTSGTVGLWDLRRVEQPLDSLSLSTPGPWNKITFDASGQFLAIGGTNVKVFDWKGRTCVVELSSHTAPVTDLCWLSDVSLLSTSLDRRVATYAA